MSDYPIPRIHDYRQSRIAENLHLRSLIIQTVRRFFVERNYLEVETPLRIPAPVPESHIDAIPSGDAFLHTSPEACMKRLLSAGYERIFQICKCFRADERGHKHLPELTMLEWYTAGEDYTHMMTQCESLIRYVAQQAGFGDVIRFDGSTIDLRSTWQRLTVAEAFDAYTDMSPEKALEADRFDELMALQIEPRLGRGLPTFLYDYPTQCAALARKKPGNPSLSERFELYIGGLELCNAFSELTDPVEQRVRFEQEQKFRIANGKSAYPMPEALLTALKDMPPSTGNALGIDRLVMLFADTDRIDDVIAFTPEEL